MADKGASTPEKALALNLDRAKYGTIAEIGGGQEVARWLFHVGGAAGTTYLDYSPAEVLARLRRGDPSWEAMVPEPVAEAIRTRHLFGYAPPP